MKVLIAENFKALRKGEFVKASSENAEFIFDSDDNKLTKAVLLEIAAKNKIKVGKKDTVDVLVSTISESITLNKKIAEQNKMSDSEAVKKIVDDGVAAGLEDDEMMIQIIQSGIAYKVASKMFAKFMTDGGHRISAKSRKEEVLNILKEAEFEPETYSEVEEMLEHICKTVSDTEIGQALKLVRGYCKEFEIEMPKPEKKPRGGLKQQIFDFIAGNPTATEADLKTFIVDDKEKDEKFVARYLPILQLVNKVAGVVVDDEDENEEKAA